MSRQERFGTRDMAYSRWHRSLPDHAGRQLKYIDLDGIEVCDVCGEILALIETALDVGQTFKAATIMVRLAQRGVPPISAFVVLYRKDGDGIDRFRVRRAWPDPTRYFSLTPDQWAQRLIGLRTCHPIALAA